MTANGVKRVSSQELAKAGISMGDIVWLRSMRKSPVRSSPMYQKLLGKVKAVVHGGHSGVPAAA